MVSVPSQVNTSASSGSQLVAFVQNFKAEQGGKIKDVTFVADNAKSVPAIYSRTAAALREARPPRNNLSSQRVLRVQPPNRWENSCKLNVENGVKPPQRSPKG